MNKSFFGGVVVSAEADAVARELIQEWHIPKLYNLAFLLNINRCFDDHQVLRLWVQSLIDNEQVDLTDLSQYARLRLSSLVA
ncbi:hypothetical protein P256_01528 [Acinetobacter nectaris CIP 110549]|uniref:Uncharacterized protein n=2 Tax=Acinetobacter nectaris TaxID=1219382 RepID=V2UTP1_9GAMM|nr:hypothetical protein P256_01528 [Acinetobacter nectaris CIP 110549]